MESAKEGGSGAAASVSMEAAKDGGSVAAAMESAKDGGSGAVAAVSIEAAKEGGSGSGRDWSRLPGDVLVSVLREVHVADAVRSGAVCTSWHAAYATFRQFCVPSLRQSPCLIYACDAFGPGAAALHCPATGDTLRIPFPRPPLTRCPLIGSAHGCLVTVDEASDLHLLDPVTGAQVALPPIATIHHVEVFTNEQGKPMYNVFDNLFEIEPEPTVLDAPRAYEYMYYRVVLSASPFAGRACVVLLLHTPQGGVSFARLGDERWTWVAPGDETGLRWSDGYRDAMYSDFDGLFYLLSYDASMVSLDLNGPSPVAREILGMTPKSTNPVKHLVQTPSGDILQVWRLRNYDETSTPVDLPYVDDEENEFQNPCLELNTVDVKIYKVDLHGQRLDMIESLPDYALFIGLNGSMCLPVKDFPGLKPNCAYMADDFVEYIYVLKYNRREIGIWSIAEQTMSSLDASVTWLNWPSPIWITPSFSSCWKI